MPEPALIGDFLDAVAAGRAVTAMRLVMKAARDHDPDELVTSLLAAVQQEAGRRWEFDEWTEAREHAATAMVDDALAVLEITVATDPDPDAAPTMALACAEGEWHLTPARMAAARFRFRGWAVRLLGASLPPAGLARTLDELRPEVLAVSCTYPANLPGARRTVQVAHDLGIPAVVGGAAVDGHEQRAAAIGADAAGEDLDEAEAIIHGWLTHPGPLSSPARYHREEVARLRREGPRVLEEVTNELTVGFPQLGSARGDQRQRIVEAMHDTLEHLEVALDVDDPAVVDDFLAWLIGVLAVRGITERTVAAGLDAIGRRLDDDLRVAWELLDESRDRVGV